MINGKLHIRFQLTPRSMTLNCCKFELSENFARFCRFGRQQLLHEWVWIHIVRDSVATH